MSTSIQMVDTNVTLFEWPFRRLPFSRTEALVEKLRRHGVREAWAGTFEGLLAKDLAGANERLAEECAGAGRGMLRPVGSVNPMWPGWQEDLRRCHEVHRMHAVRLHPGYHGYGVEHAEFERLLRAAAERGLLVQIALEMEDVRVQHPLLKAPPVNPAPLVRLLPTLPAARVQLLNSWAWTRQAAARPLLELENVTHDIAGLEAVGGVRRMLEGNHWYYGGKVALERLLFGSHVPYFPVEATLLRMFESRLSAAQLAAVLENNARRVGGTAGGAR